MANYGPYYGSFGGAFSNVYSQVSIDDWNYTATQARFWCNGGYRADYDWTISNITAALYIDKGGWYAWSGATVSGKSIVTGQGGGSEWWLRNYGTFDREAADYWVRLRCKLTFSGSEANADTDYLFVPHLASAPTGLSASRVSDNQVNLSWTLPSTSLDSVRLEVSIDGGSWSEFASVSGSATSASYTQASADHSYRFRARGYYMSSYSSYTSATAAISMAPSAPQSISGAASGGTNVTVTLANSSPVATSLEYQTSTDGGSTWSASTTVQGSPVTSFVATVSGGTVVLRVRNVNSAGASAWLVSDPIVTITPPAAPTLLSPTGVLNMSDGEVTFSWLHNSLDGSAQTAAQLEYSDDGFLTATTVQLATEQSYTLSPIPWAAGTTISWHVRTKGADPSYGDWASAKTFTAYQVPTLSFVANKPPTTVSTLPIPIEVTYTDPQGMACAAAYYQLFEGTRQVAREDMEISGGTLTQSITASEFLPVNGQTYTLTVTARSGSSLSASVSVTFTVDYVPPRQADLDISNDPDTGYASLLVKGMEGKSAVTHESKNMTGFFSNALTDTVYWFAAANLNTYGTRLSDGWASFTLSALNLNVSPRLAAWTPKKSTQYTAVLEVRNSTITGSLLWRGYTQATSVWTASVNTPVTGDGIYRIKVTSKADFTGVTHDRMFFDTSNGTFDGDIRVSIYEGDYTGEYEPALGNYAVLDSQQGDYIHSVAFEGDAERVVAPTDSYSGNTNTQYESEPNVIRSLNVVGQSERMVSRNLLPSFTDYTDTVNGTTIVNSGGVYRFSGTSTGSHPKIVYFDEDFTIPNGAYLHLFNTWATGNVVFNFRKGSATVTGDINCAPTNKIFSLANYAGMKVDNIFIYVANGMTNMDFTASPMITTSATAVEWEPYFDPYLLSIDNVRVSGRNLVGAPYAYGNSYTSNGVTFSVNADGSFHVQGTATSDASYYIKSNQAQFSQYISGASMLTVSGLGGNVHLIYSGAGAGYNGVAYKDTSADGSYACTPTDTTKPFNYIVLRVTNGSTANTNVYLQLELGSTAHAYEPYSLSTITTPLRGLPQGSADELVVSKTAWRKKDRTWQDTISAVGTLNTSGSTWYAAITATNQSTLRRNWTSADDFNADRGTTGAEYAYCEKTSKVSAAGTGIYLARTWNSLYAYCLAADATAQGITQTDFDALVGAEFIARNKTSISAETTITPINIGSAFTIGTEVDTTFSMTADDGTDPYVLTTTGVGSVSGGSITHQALNLTTNSETYADILDGQWLAGIGDIKDSYADGVITRRIGCVDLGSLTWVADGTGVSGVYRMAAELAGVARPSSNDVAPNMTSGKYAAITTNQTWGASATGITYGAGGNYVRVYDPNYNTSSSAAAFKTAMSGVLLYYELTTPIEVTVSEVDYQELESPDTVSLNAYMPTELTVKYGQGREDYESVSIYRVTDHRQLLAENVSDGFSVIDRYAPLNTDYVYEVWTYASSGAFAVHEVMNRIESDFWFAYWGERMARAKWNPDNGGIQISRPQKTRVYYAGRKDPVSYDGSAVALSETPSWMFIEQDEVRPFIQLIEDGGRGVYKSCDGWVYHADFDLTLSPSYTALGYYGKAGLTITRIAGESL